MKTRSTMNRSLMVLLFMLTGLQFLCSQENHYWSQQFGAVSSLMGGAMIAGVRDNSAAFYNPGALTFVEFPNMSVDANIYKFDKLYISDGAGKGINLNSSQMTIYPQIISGMMNYIKVPGLKFSYTILTRNFSNILMSSRYTRNNEGDTGSRYLGEFDYLNQLTEQWFGFCASYKVKEKLGIGVTLFGTYHGQTTSYTHNSKESALGDSLTSLSASGNTETVKYMSIGFLAKFGLAYETGRWRFGFSLTTPSVGLYGDGSVKREESFYQYNTDPSTSQKPWMISAENRSTPAIYHHPLAFGFGMEYNSSVTRIALSGEYYSKIGSYYIMKASNNAFVFPVSLIDSSGMKEKIDQYLYTGAESKPVFNIGLGFDQALGKYFNLMVGARTDFSSYTYPENTQTLYPGSGNWDLYHFSAGASYHRALHTLTLGFTYCFSPTVKIDPIVIVSPGSEPVERANLDARSFGVVLGYTYYFPR